MKRTEVPITTTPGSRGDTNHTHPSFGTISAHRINGHQRLFGSNVDTGGFVRVEIHEAVLVEGDYNERIHGTAKTLISVDMSEAQWAQFVSRMNVGSGTPCTLSIRPVKYELGWFDVPLTESAEEKFTRRTESMKAHHREGITSTAAEVIALARKKITGKAFEEFKRTMDRLVGHLEANQRFAAEVLTEHKENLVTEMKTEIHAMLTDHVLQLGLRGLHGMSGPAPKTIEHDPT